MCDFCENIIQKQGRNFELYEVAIVYDTEEKEYSIADDLGEYLGIDYCPLCGRKLGEETEYSDSIRQTIKEVAEEMPALGKYDGDYASPCGTFGYMDDLYRVDFSCSNCGKRHEGIIFGTEIVCSCGKKIKTGS